VGVNNKIDDKLTCSHQDSFEPMTGAATPINPYTASVDISRVMMSDFDMNGYTDIMCIHWFFLFFFSFPYPDTN
jgi:hypothetical protein